jgi:hydroxymethylglutaryl-CoA lyase
MPDVLMREVGLRDGLQIVNSFLPTQGKVEWINLCVAAGLRELEIGSFVPPQYIPQFQDVEAVCAHAHRIMHLQTAALVPNLKGAQRALEAGVGTLVCLTSATESFSQANLRRSRVQSSEELVEIIHLRDRFAGHGQRARIQVGISVAFGCPFEGRVRDAEVLTAALSSARAGADEISLADTSGQGDPRQVRRMFTRLSQELPHLRLCAHFHDTRGTGLANVLAALDAGVRSFDASLGGLGGCPNSPGATGNIVLEDTVFMLEAMGLDTGIDLDRLFEIRRFITRQLPGVSLFGHVAEVGLPSGFVAAAAWRSSPEVDDGHRYAT